MPEEIKVRIDTYKKPEGLPIDDLAKLKHYDQRNLSTKGLKQFITSRAYEIKEDNIITFPGWTMFQVKRLPEVRGIYIAGCRNRDVKLALATLWETENNGTWFEMNKVITVHFNNDCVAAIEPGLVTMRETYIFAYNLEGQAMGGVTAYIDELFIKLSEKDTAEKFHPVMAMPMVIPLIHVDDNEFVATDDSLSDDGAFKKAFFDAIDYKYEGGTDPIVVSSKDVNWVDHDYYRLDRFEIVGGGSGFYAWFSTNYFDEDEKKPIFKTIEVYNNREYGKYAGYVKQYEKKL